METNPDCPCTYPGCPRHGDCDACQKAHVATGVPTACGKTEDSGQN